MKVLTVVGRAEKLGQFESALGSYLSKPFTIKATIPLTEDSEAKSFLAYIDAGAESETVEDELFDNLAQSLTSFLYEAVVHDSPEEAINYVNEEYKGELYSSFMEPISAQEIFRRDVFMGLAGAGEVAMLRGLLDKQPVIALVHIANGHGDNDNLVTPLAILIDDDLGARLELPFRSSYNS